jgi:hypothetical protein
LATRFRLRDKTLGTGVPMKTVDSKILSLLFLALLVGLSALWYVTRFNVIPPREGITVESSGDLRNTPSMRRTPAPIPRHESSQE